MSPFTEKIRRKKWDPLVRDEFYTQYSDIENIVEQINEQFAGKTVYCPCDNWKISKFVEYFETHFSDLGLKRLIATGIDNSFEKGYYYDSETDTRTELDTPLMFQSLFCQKFWKDADIIVTNPPFSACTEFLDYIFNYNKQYLCIAPLTQFTTKHFRQFLDGNMSVVGSTRQFINPEGKMYNLANIFWITNLDDTKNPELELTKTYDDSFWKFDGTDIINVDSYKDIPKDYDGVVAVPMSYVLHHNPEQFELVREIDSTGKSHIRTSGVFEGYHNGKAIFSRVLIRRKDSDRIEKLKEHWFW